MSCSFTWSQVCPPMGLDRMTNKYLLISPLPMPEACFVIPYKKGLKMDQGIP